MRLISLDHIIQDEMTNPEFRSIFLGEAISQLVSGDFDSGLRLLRHFGAPFEAQVAALGENPSARELFQVIATIQRAEAATILQVRLVEPDEVEAHDLPESVHSVAA